MPISVFVSRPTPFTRDQVDFMDHLHEYLRSRDLAGRTIGQTDYGTHPFRHVRSVLTDCNGVLAVALRRFHIVDGADRPSADQRMLMTSRRTAERRSDMWLTTPYVHIELAMAFNMGLPSLIIVEKGVELEGAIERGVMMMYPIEVDLSGDWKNWFRSDEWKQLINTWEGQVRQVVFAKGNPPPLYRT